MNEEERAEFRNLFGPKIGDEVMDNLQRVRDKLAEDGISGILIAPDDAMYIQGNPPPGLVAELDQALQARRDNRADAAEAVAEARCAKPPMGCGQPLSGGLSGHFRDQQSRREYDITHLCQLCQDQVFRPDPYEVLEMARRRDHERCGVCGEWRGLEYVDVGVGVISGHNCCADVRFGGAVMPPRCTKIEGCQFAADHQYDCDTGALDVEAGWQRLRAWMVENGYIEDEDE